MAKQKVRRHHNNTGERQVRRGKTYYQVMLMARRMGVPFGSVVETCERSQYMKKPRAINEVAEMTKQAAALFGVKEDPLRGDEIEFLGVRVRLNRYDEDRAAAKELWAALKAEHAPAKALASLLLAAYEKGRDDEAESRQYDVADALDRRDY